MGSGPGTRAGWLAISLFILLNLGIGILSGPLRYLDDQDRFVWKTRIAYLNRRAPDRLKMAFLGDSQIMSGILPAVIDPTGTSVNLGLPSMQPEGIETLLLEPVLKKNTEMIFFNPGPYSLYTTDNTASFGNYIRSVAPVASLGLQGRGLLYRNASLARQIPSRLL